MSLADKFFNCALVQPHLPVYQIQLPGSINLGDMEGFQIKKMKAAALPERFLAETFYM